MIIPWKLPTRTVDVHILNLRKKLKSIADRIITIKNVGYRLELEGWYPMRANLSAKLIP